MSLFSKDPTARAPLTAYERIAPEISHLRKGSSVRHRPGAAGKGSAFFIVTVICVLLGLYFMDPFLYALRKYEAVRTYLYLHNCGTESQTRALIASQIFSEGEIAVLNRRQGSFQDYFSSPTQAAAQADSIENYMNGLRDLHAGNYQQLDFLGKVRYQLFIRTGVPLPTSWSSLNPSVE